MPEKGIDPTINLAISPKPVANPQSADHDDTRLGNKGSGINSVLSPRFTIRNSNGGAGTRPAPQLIGCYLIRLLR